MGTGDSVSDAATLDKSQSIQDNSGSGRNVKRIEECARSISQSQIRPMVIRIVQVEIQISLSQPQIARDLSFKQIESSSSVIINTLAGLCNDVWT